MASTWFVSLERVVVGGGQKGGVVAVAPVLSPVSGQAFCLPSGQSQGH